MLRHLQACCKTRTAVIAWPKTCSSQPCLRANEQQANDFQKTTCAWLIEAVFPHVELPLSSLIVTLIVVTLIIVALMLVTLN